MGYWGFFGDFLGVFRGVVSGDRKIGTPKTRKKQKNPKPKNIERGGPRGGHLALVGRGCGEYDYEYTPSGRDLGGRLELCGRVFGFWGCGVVGYWVLRFWGFGVFGFSGLQEFWGIVVFGGVSSCNSRALGF